MFTRLRPLYTTFSGLFALASLGVLIALAVVAPGIWGEQGSVIDVSGAWQPPSPAHLLGTDELGRDIFARLMSATRLSLLSAATATLLAVAIGIPLGLLAAAFGRFASRAFQSVINVAIAFPALLTAMFVGTIIGIGLPGAIAGVGIALTPIFARLTQTLTASVASLDYVAAARTMGIGRLKLVSRHILPNVAEPLIISATTSVGVSLLGISALSFLGLGARPPEYDWGGLLSDGLSIIYSNPLAAIGPGAAIAFAGITFSLLGESVAGAFSDGSSSRASDRVAIRMARSVPPRPRVSAARPAAADDTAPLLDVRNLTVSFPSDGGPVSPVREVTFSMREGERTGIVGESGSGKSLTVMAIAQLLAYPAVVGAKRLEFLGQELSTLSRDDLRSLLVSNLAVVFQNPMSSLNPALTIETQVTEAVRVHGGLTRAQAREQALDVLADVGIPEPERRLRQHPHELSGGQRQRVMIATGLMETPRLIIADEPTTALDVTIQQQILELLRRINEDEGAAILLISHDIAVIQSMCERVLVMYAGRIIEDVPRDALLEAAHPYTRALIDAVPDMHTDRSRALATVPGRPPVPSELGTGCAFAPRCAFATELCREQDPELAPRSPGHLVACWHPQGTVVAAAVELQLEGGSA